MTHNSSNENIERGSRLLTTKQLPSISGFSKSYFEKGRSYNYGPPFIRIMRNGRTGKILYRESDVLDWLDGNKHNPEEPING